MFVAESALGAHAYDGEGRRYVDYVMAYGPLLFGHTHPALTTGLDELARGGHVWGSTHAEEVRLAERVRRHLPAMERLRFVTTGTEAMMSAVRVARAFTGRNAILKFAGCYHGHFDLALLDAGASAGGRGGIPDGVRRDVFVARYNDLASVDDASRGRRDDLAAILVEPIAGNMGFVAPEPGFLEGLRERANRWGALLVFDEVITWLRFGLPGAQGRTGVSPDLTALGKIMGGGLPIAAFGGRRDVMDVLAPAGDTFTGGTHGGNPFCVGMAHRVLDLLERHPEYYAADECRSSATGRWVSRNLRAAQPSVCGRPAGVDRRLQVPRGRSEPELRRRARRRQSRLFALLPRDARTRRPAAPVAERGHVRLHRPYARRR